MDIAIYTKCICNLPSQDVRPLGLDVCLYRFAVDVLPGMRNVLGSYASCLGNPRHL
jgi:hypothetical protein